MPEQRLAPRHDPMIDVTRRERVWAAIGRWSAGIGLTLALAAVGGYLDSLDAAAEVRAKQRELDEAARHVAQLQHQLAVRVAAGSCSTLFYLIEADSLEMAGNKLLQASMQVATVANSALYERPTPPGYEGRP